MKKNFDVTVTFKADVFADCNKTSLFLNDVIAEAFATNEKRYVEIYYNNINGQIIASKKNEGLYPVIKAGTVITFNSISEDDYEMYLQPDLEMLYDYESKNPIPYTDIEKYMTIEKTEATGEVTNENELEQKREQAQQKFEELVKAEVEEEKEKEQKAKEELGFDKLFTVEGIKQNSKTHYFVIFNEKVDYEKYKKLETLAHFYNGKYHVENEKRGFYFKSAKSKDNFMNVTSLEMTAEQEKKLAKREAYEVVRRYS